MNDKKIGAPFKLTKDILLSKFNLYIEYMQDQFFLKPDIIRSGERAGEQINIKINRPLTIQSFCLFAGIDVQTYYNHVNGDYKDQEPDLFDGFMYVNDYIKNDQISGAMVNIYNERIVSKVCGLADTVNVQVNEQPVVNININALTGRNNAALNENNIQDIEFEVLDPIELRQINDI